MLGGVFYAWRRCFLCLAPVFFMPGASIAHCCEAAYNATRGPQGIMPTGRLLPPADPFGRQ
jgi:hypothetical protein